MYAITLGGGQINNPGRYLVLVPPINGEAAISAATNSPYFSLPRDKFKAWDSSFTFDWMPRQYITFRWEYAHRHADVPYWSGRGGLTPPGGNNGYPTAYACNSGAAAIAPSNNGIMDLAQAQAFCAGNGNGGVWFPDTRKDENLIDMDIMVKF